MSPQPKPCPKCGGLGRPRQSDGHFYHQGTHQVAHNAVHHPALAAIALAAMAAKKLFGSNAAYECARCGHKF